MSPGDPTSGEMCARPGCNHDADEHEPVLGFCERQNCQCLMYVSESEAYEDALTEDGLPDELDFDEDDR